MSFRGQWITIGSSQLSGRRHMEKESYKYKAFISYSHKDEKWGRWLHNR